MTTCRCKMSIDRSDTKLQIGTVRRGIAPSPQNVCAANFEIECQPALVASPNTCPRPCDCMWDGPFSISPVLAKTKTGLFHRRTATPGVIREWSPTTGAAEATKAPLWQTLGACDWIVPSFGSGRKLPKRAGQFGFTGWKVSGNRFDDCKSEPSLRCEQDARLWSIPNARAESNDKALQACGSSRSGGLGGFCFNQCVLRGTVWRVSDRPVL